MTKLLAFAQKLVSADKTAIASSLVGILTVLAAKFGFKLNGSDVAYVSAGVMAGLGLFVHAHFATTSVSLKNPFSKPAPLPPVSPPASTS